MWQHKNTFTVGGLYNAGYAPGQDALLILSSQGRGIVNCITGAKTDRDYSEDWTINEQTGEAIGFGSLAGVTVLTGGIFGEDVLPKTTADDWLLMATDPEPDDKPFEKYMVRSIYLVSPHMAKRLFITKDGPCELRTFGFSDTGNSFVVATSCEVIIYSRI